MAEECGLVEVGRHKIDYSYSDHEPQASIRTFHAAPNKSIFIAAKYSVGSWKYVNLDFYLEAQKMINVSDPKTIFYANSGYQSWGINIPSKPEEGYHAFFTQDFPRLKPEEGDLRTILNESADYVKKMVLELSDYRPLSRFNISLNEAISFWNHFVKFNPMAYIIGNREEEFHSLLVSHLYHKVQQLQKQ